MAPRAFTNPAPITESAKQARKAFFCELCQKGYARQNEFDTHESSYEHNHKRRLKDLQAMNRNMGSQATEKSKDKGGGGMIKINPIDGDAKKNASNAPAKGGFKKSGFKSLVQTVGQDGAVKEEVVKVEPMDVDRDSLIKMKDTVESDTEDEGYEVYDPRKPTGCQKVNCKAR